MSVCLSVYLFIYPSMSLDVCLSVYLSIYLIYLSSIFFRFHLFIFRQRGREEDREREKHQCVVASRVTPTGYWPKTQACALTGDPTSDPLVCKPVLNSLSHTSQTYLSPIFICLSIHPSTHPSVHHQPTPTPDL